MKPVAFFAVILGVLSISACGQAASFSPPSTTGPEPAPAALLSTATAGAPVPAGWATHTSQSCEYVISYPSEMHVTEQPPYSATFGFNLGDAAAGARNFIYVSVITPDVQARARDGVYQNDVYNYDPAEEKTLLGMQVGESKSVRDIPSVASAFTYQRMPDATIGGHAAQAYENARPWEFPQGTREIRYYVSMDGCTYQVGGYVAAAHSDQPGAITEELFDQVIATIRLMP